MATPRHVISVSVQGVQLYGWATYNIDTSINGGAGTFSLTIPFTRERWDLLVPDRQVTVMIDATPIITGPIDTRQMDDDESIAINGRDWVGRLVSESAPNVAVAGLDAHALITKVAAPWFAVVATSNARNRKVSLGRGIKAKAGNRATTRPRPHKPVRIEPGQMRWQIIEDICTQIKMLAWASGDGRELIVAAPDYDQGVQFSFFQPAANSTRTKESTVIGLGIHDSIADRYSQIIVVGSGAGTDANYGQSVSARYGEARNAPTTDGTGKDFYYPKRLVMQSDVASAQDARDQAAFEMARRDSEGHVVTVRAAGHGQFFNGALGATIFALDTIASVEDERTGVAGKYTITACNYASGRGAGETTKITLLKKGSVLAL